MTHAHVTVGRRVALMCRSPVPHETADHASPWLPDSRLGRVGDHTSVQWQDCPIRKTAHCTTLLCDCLFLIGKAGDHTSLWIRYSQIGRRQTTVLRGRFATALCHNTRYGDSRTPVTVVPGGYLVSPNLGADLVRTFRIDRNESSVSVGPAASVTEGTGPRHATFWSPTWKVGDHWDGKADVFLFVLL